MNPLRNSCLVLVFIAVFFQFPDIRPLELSDMNEFLASNANIKIASAASMYGILGQTAPELDLDHWIDGNGKAIPPIRLADYRGKVVYLYFLQDW